MSFAAVTWAYKDLITSAKLAQMQENIRAHDHRLDGTQGDPAAVIAGPTFGAAAVNVAAATPTTIGTIVLPATTRKSTLWIDLTWKPQGTFTRLDITMATLDARITTNVFASTTGYTQSLVGPGVSNGSRHDLIALPVGVGAATGTSMAFSITSFAVASNECRILWWLDS